MLRPMSANSPDSGPASVGEAAAARERGALFLDVRTDAEWDEGRIPGATHIRLDELATRAGELDPAAELIVYCHVGNRSAVAVEALTGAGYRARNLEGGIKAWSQAGEPVDPEGAKVE